MDAEEILNRMKEEGVGGAIISKEGALIASTIQISDVPASIASSIINMVDGIMKKQKDSQQIVEMGYEDKTIILIPTSKSIFCGVATSKEQKQTIIKYAKMASSL